MRMNKLFVFGSAMIISVLAACIIAGCGTKGAEKKDVINLRFVTYDNGSVPLDAKEVIAAANKVSAEKIGVTVDLEFQSKEKINLIMASGEYYDMIFTSSWVNQYDKYAPAGMFYDITELVQSKTPDLYRSVGDYWDCAKVDGRIYAVPIMKDMGTEDMFRFNADYFEGEKGMTIPERMTFADLEQYLAAYKQDYPDKYPLAMDKAGLAGFYNFVQRVVDPIIVIPYGQDEPKALPFWECDELMDRYRLLHKWYEAGYIHPDAATIDSTAADKTIPVRPGVAWKGYMGYSNPADWGFNVKTSIYDGPYLSRPSEQGAMTAICAGCDEEHVEACLKYLELLATDRKFRDILGYGIEGKHFNYMENGTVLRTTVGSERYNTKLYQTGSVVNASVESISTTLLSDPDQWTKVYEEYKENGIHSVTKGFAYDPTPKEDIITALNAIYNDYAAELRTGTSDPDKVIPRIKARMEEAGLNELLEDIQQKLDESMKE